MDKDENFPLMQNEIRTYKFPPSLQKNKKGQLFLFFLEEKGGRGVRNLYVNYFRNGLIWFVDVWDLMEKHAISIKNHKIFKTFE